MSTLWQRLSFSDVTPFIKELAKRSATEEDFTKISYVQQTVSAKDDYPSFELAQPKLKKSTTGAMRHYERKTLLGMFAIHITDVHLSILGALLSVQVLRSFEDTSQFKLTRFFGIESGVETLWFVAALAILIFLSNILAATLHAHKIEREMLISFRVQRKITEYLFKALTQMSRSGRQKFQTGDLINVAQTDGRYLAELYGHAYIDFFVLIISSAVIVYVMYLILGIAAFVGLFLLFLQLPISLIFTWIEMRLHKELMRRSDSRISLITEWIQGMRLVRYFGWDKHFLNNINHLAQSEFKQDLKLGASYCFAFSLSSYWWMIVSVGVFAAFLYLGQGKDVGSVFAAIWLTTILGHQLTPLPWFVSCLTRSRVASKRLEEIFNAPSQVEEFNDLNGDANEFVDSYLSSQDLSEYSIGFVLENVSVEYDGRFVLKNLNVHLQSGKLTSVVGKVGSGKSLLIQLLLGEVVPTEGKVYLEITLNLRKEKVHLHSPLGLRVLRKSLAYVPQEAFIATATVRENVPLQYVDELSFQHTDNDIMNALLHAQMGSDVGQLEHGLNTELGERGVNLSGGQKQRLSLARSVYRKSKIVLLDDPLSAVDKKTEKKLIAVLFSEKQNRFILWTTHRVEHLKLSDEILIMDAGRILDKGTFAELLLRNTQAIRELENDQ